MFDTLAYKLSVLYKNFYAYASARLHPFGLHNAWIFSYSMWVNTRTVPRRS